MLTTHSPTDVEMHSEFVQEMTMTEHWSYSASNENTNMSISQLSSGESDWPADQNKLKSLICQLWNLKSFTVDYCAPDDYRNTDLTCLREVISYKIA